MAAWGWGHVPTWYPHVLHILFVILTFIQKIF